MKSPDSSIILMKATKESRYLPHQSSRECKRRMRQIAAGTLKDASVTISARYQAAGLSSLDDINIIERLQ